MINEKRQMQVLQSVKTIVEEIKEKRELKNESQVIAYLYAIYEGHFPKLTLEAHEKALERMKQICNQLTF